MPEFITRALIEIPRQLLKPAVREFCLGILAATHAFLWLSWFAATWGNSLTVVVALAIAFGVALLLSGRFSAASGVNARGAGAGTQLLLAGWTLALPGLLSFSPEFLRRLPLDVAERPLMIFAVILIAALLLVAPGWIVLLQSVMSTRADKGSRKTTVVSPWMLLGAAGLLFLMPMTLAVVYDLQAISWTVSGISLLIGGMLWRAQRHATQPTGGECDDTPGTTSPTASRPIVGDLWIGLLAGTALAVAVRITGQLIADLAYAACSQLAGLIAGIAIGVWLRRWRRERTSDPVRSEVPVAESIVIAYGVAALVVLFPQLTNAALQISANVSHTFSIFLLRGGLLGASLLPFGIAIGLRVASGLLLENCGRFDAVTRTLTAVMFSFAATRAIDVPVAAGLAMTGATACGCLVIGWCWRPTGTHHRRRIALSIALVAPLVAGVFLVSRFDSNRSARILFSTQAFLAYRAGTPADQLHQIDDGRLIGEFNHDGSTWTAWLHAGHQLVVRENGVPRGINSLNTNVCPQVPTEMLPSVLPLVIHPAPREVTVVGCGGMTALAGCLAFPVSHVTCVEPNRGLLAVAEQCGFDDAARNPLDDSRLRVVCVEPVVAAAMQQSPQDIIILNRPQASLWDASAEYTATYYRRLAENLAPGGLLCQRLYYGDFGAQPIRDMAATLRNVFAQVILIETGPGELLFIASRDAQAIVGPDVLHRASRPHVRALLSGLGWDWSVLLAMTTLDVAAIDKIADSDSARTNTMVSGRFTYQLPVEVARWADKHQEIQDLLGPDSTRLFGLIENESGVQDLVLRLADVAERQRITDEHPDVFWAYRHTLRSRLQERPRLTIQQVGHEGLGRGLHPEDERRKEFLLALNDAATQSAPDTDALDSLARFIEPYDPLVSDFVHHELAHLYARADVPDPGAELTHRLHTVFFASSRDQSVRNVSEAIELIIEQPQVLPDPLRRWDTLNALLEVLMQRWQLRSLAEEASRYEAADANDSYDAAQDALNAMDELAPDAAISSEDWQIRRSLLQQHLIRPLRDHRSEQRT